MTIPRYEAVCDYWERCPPLSSTVLTIAQSLGAKLEPPKKKDAAQAENDRQGLIDMLGSSGFKQERPAWLGKTT